MKLGRIVPQINTYRLTESNTASYFQDGGNYIIARPPAVLCCPLARRARLTSVPDLCNLNLETTILLFSDDQIS